MKKMRSSKGFTLIELLVVIAIIGILSSVVLASLTTARSRGTEAAVRNELSNMRAQAELFYSSTGNYGTVGTAGACSGAGTLFTTSGTGLATLIAGLQAKSVTPSCAASGTPSSQWSVVAPLNGVNWCVDGTGFSGTSSSATADGTC